MINKLEIVFANGSTIKYENVSFFQFHDGRFFVRVHGERAAARDTSKEHWFKIEEVMSIYVLETKEDEPSLNLPFDSE